MTPSTITQHLSSFIKRYFEGALLLALITITSLYAFMGIQKHYHFQTFGWDTAVFDQEIYLLSQGSTPYSSLLGMHGLGDHFQILTFVFGYLGYQIYTHVNMLFIIQALSATISAIPLYLLGLTILSRHVTPFKAKLISALLAGMYLLSVPFQAMLTDEYHNEPLILTPLLFIFYFLEKRNWLGYWISFILSLLNKEVFGLFSIPLSIYVYLKTKNFRHSIATLVVGIGIFILLVKFIMPNLAGSLEYIHFKPGNDPSTLISSFIKNPSLILTSFYDSPAKQLTIISSLLVFAFLPVLAPVELIAPIFSLAIRFYDNSVPRLHEFNNHFAAPLIPFMAVAAIYGLDKVLAYLKHRSLLKYYWILCGILFFTILAQAYVYHGPLNSLAKPSFYYTQPWERDAHALIKQVPKDVIISTQNSLLPHLSQRSKFYLLPEIGEAEYIAVDLTEGANKFYKSDLSRTESMIQDLITQQKYQIIWNQGKSYLLKKL